jgi:hypothetical protein
VGIEGPAFYYYCPESKTHALLTIMGTELNGSGDPLRHIVATTEGAEPQSGWLRGRLSRCPALEPCFSATLGAAGNSAAEIT